MKKLPTILLLLAGLAVTQRAEKLAPVGEVASLKPVLLEMFGRNHYDQIPAGMVRGRHEEQFRNPRQTTRGHHTINV